MKKIIYKSKLKKIKTYSARNNKKYIDKYFLDFYFSKKYDQISEFVYYHLLSKYKTLRFYRRFSNNQKFIQFGIENLSKNKALQIKEYADKLILPSLP